ncbi:hypothetical protein G6F57_004299 [Rhizopus arrhizus]|uniref:Major facilitator superfamily (MFS) profile domain-containing protein n=1 Tax=Rhizopus oryzae TaxID=64495 RepID=A0A9P7BU98_RHIOR|nr:hypothetical protein G6F23_004026 [Rhizopus arrhizus]KAG1420620.1 hypothetical protein G6F58_004099 [Rhizopus delemar]KAG0766573.1 hypothetical protein G6F24_003495 [Rhizopus arrhizus]KAG0787778.1 hypothetical protein G6F21_007675 [Rhizopus arrhizus]KAG0800626.1 hypothetical protein G6F22_002043 [Rhizopus arrhizus]
MDYLDRANIGNATLAGIQDDLHLTPKQLSMAISGFYITYILFEVPSNVVLKRVNAVKWLSLIMLIWGIMTLAMAFAKDFASLFALRLLLGAAESGYIPGILYLMSKAYKPRQLTTRVAMLLCMSSLSGVVSGPIAYATSFLDGNLGLNGWQYLFILEGAPTICLSVLSYFCLFDDIKNVSWLTSEQKEIHKLYMQTEENNAHVNTKTIVKACLNWKTALFSTTYALSAIIFTSYQVFTPIIIDGFGFPVLTSQLLSAPPNVLQLMSILLGGYLSDHYKNKRGLVITIGFSIAALGFLLLGLLENRWAKYGSLFIIPLGIGLQNAANVSWSSINFPILEIRAVAVATVVMIGNTGGVIASYLYPLNDGPHYYFGNSFNLTCGLLGAAVSLLTSYLLYRQNCKLDSQHLVEYGNGEKTRTQFRYYY